MSSRLVSCGLVLALGVLAACSRELVGLSSRAPEPPAPAFLGQLAGEYRMVLEADEAVGAAFDTTDPLRFPLLGNVVLMHLVDNEGGNSIVGVLNLASRADSPGLLATLVGDDIVGTVFAKDAETGEDREEDLEGRRLVGGEAIAVDSGLRLCGASEPRPLYGDRSCKFNEALSGMFELSVGTCTGELEPSGFLGVGVLRDFVLLARYPNYERLDWGVFDHYVERGFAFVGYTGGGAKQDFLHAAFSMSEAEGVLTFDEQTFATARAPKGVEQALTYDRCIEHAQATRLAGGSLSVCPGPLDHVKLYSGAWTVPHPTDTASYRMYVAAVDVEDPGSTERMQALVRRPQSGLFVAPVDLATLQPEEIPPNVVAIYDVPAAAADYELYILRREASGAIGKLAPAQCVRSELSDG